MKIRKSFYAYKIWFILLLLVIFIQGKEKSILPEKMDEILDISANLLSSLADRSWC